MRLCFESILCAMFLLHSAYYSHGILQLASGQQRKSTQIHQGDDAMSMPVKRKQRRRRRLLIDSALSAVALWQSQQLVQLPWVQLTPPSNGQHARYMNVNSASSLLLLFMAHQRIPRQALLREVPGFKEVQVVRVQTGAAQSTCTC